MSGRSITGIVGPFENSNFFDDLAGIAIHYIPKNFSKEGRYMDFPSGEIDMRPQPPSNVFSHKIFSVVRSIRCND